MAIIINKHKLKNIIKTWLEDRFIEFYSKHKPSFFNDLFIKIYGKRFASGGVIKQAQGFDKFRKNIIELNIPSKK